MDWAVIGAMVGFAALIVQGIVAFGMAGKEATTLKRSGQSVRRLREQALARRWTWDGAASEPTVPVGRMGQLSDVRQRGAARGRFRKREASVAVLAAVVPSGFESRLEIDHGTTVLTMVVTMEAPELTGDLCLDPQRGEAGYDISGSLAAMIGGDPLAALARVQNPAVDVVDGRASFLFTSLRGMDELDRVLAAADDFLSGLSAGRPSA
ncbi:hypothetical protein Q0Z83_011250 [Actinoplanes sichuanensis]|uniref:Uncharacterized protein n=1 Tax=Actinoplanes sichuanensis TaxID=512349 RepID=A0ABW4AQ50_9ACTN|nr:hypothetical protein [Actinoplanes sichuanensis]BEL02934.1 hypothetical protein Q0Z83_011250 [Actinoplanes sichuanensis]